MSTAAIFIFIISVILLLASAVPGNERCVALAQYIMLIAILVEVGCIHETLKEK